MSNHVKLGSRPESARTQDTKLTLASESNISTFSETDAFAVRKKTEQPPSDFGQHVEQLDKQKRFKHLSGLTVIPEKKENEELKNQTCKPFEGRRSSNVKKTERADISKPEKPVLTAKPSKSQSVQQANVSGERKGQTKTNNFLQKSLSKMNELVVGSKDVKVKERKVQVADSNLQNSSAQQEAVRLNFAAFVANDPVKRRQEEAFKAYQKKSPERIKPSKDEKGDTSKELDKMLAEANQRRLRNAQLSQYVNERELRNLDSFPRGYEAAIESMSNRQVTEHNLEELERLDVSSYDVGEFGDREIVAAMQNIRELDKKIDRAQKHPEEVTKEQDDLEYSRDSSLSQLKKSNNLFLTEILKQGGSQQGIQTLLELEKSHNKLTRLDKDELEESSSDEADETFPRETNRILQRNRIEAAGGLFQQCDYLSEEHKKRLEVLMTNIESPEDDTATPFDLSEAQQQHLRRLDQGISVYQSLLGTTVSAEPVIYEENLPKDPVLRKQSELKILKDKIASVNNSLRNIRSISVDRFKIKSLVERLQEAGLEQPPSTVIKETRREFEEVSKKVQDSEQFLQASMDNRASILSQLQQIRSRFVSLEAELHQLNQLSDEELEQLERLELEQRRSRLSRYQQLEGNLQEDLQSLEQYRLRLHSHLQRLDALDSEEVQVPSIDISSLRLHQTQEELDARLSALATASTRD